MIFWLLAFCFLVLTGISFLGTGLGLLPVFFGLPAALVCLVLTFVSAHLADQ
jgi:hypothetical protein